MIELSVIIPSYLEEENLRLILPRLRHVLNQMKIKNEVIIVDTATPMDKTLYICAEYQTVYLNRPNSNTYGDAIRCGIAQSKGKKVIIMDADGSHPPEFISNLYKYKDEADIIVASRYINGGQTENPTSLILLSYCINIIYSFFLKIKCKDVSNSFKLYDGYQLRNLDTKCNNFDIVEEIIVYLALNNKNIRILEIPFTFKKRLFGRTKRNLWLFAATFFTTLLRLIVIKFFYKYKKNVFRKY